MLDRAGQDRAGRPTRTGSREAAAALRDDDLPLAARVSPGAGPGRAALGAPGARAGHRDPTRTRSGSTASGRSSRPGTSSSRAPRAPRSARTARPVSTAPSPPPPSGCPAVAAMGFDVVYLPPIHPIGRINRKGRNNALVAGAGRRRLAVGDRRGRGRPRRDPPRARHARGLPRLRRGRARTTGLEVAMDLALQCAPGPPVGHRAPGVVHHPRRRHDRVRGEPAEEVPGHLPAQLRQRPGGHPRRGPAGRAALGRAGRQDLPGRQPAHQAARLLALADRRGQGGRPGRAVPGRGVHPAGHDARARQDRLHPVVHLLHLAHDGVGDAASTARSWSPRPTTCGRTSGRTRPDILHETLQHGGPPMFKIRAVLASMLSPSWGMYSGLRAVRARAAARAPRSTSTTRSSSCGPRDWAGAEAAGRSLAPLHHPAQRDPPRQPGPALAAQPALPRDRQRRRCCAGPSGTRETGNTVLVVCSFDSRNVQWGNTTLDMPALGLRLARAVHRDATSSPARRTTGASTTRSGWTRTSSRHTSSPCDRSGVGRERLTWTI